MHVVPHRPTLYISSWAWRTTACHIKSRRLACFRNNIHKMSKSSCSFIRLLLGNRATITVRNEGPLFFSFAFFPSDSEPVQSLLLRRFGIKSRTKMQHTLTANHRGDADIFLRSKREMLLWPPAKLCISSRSPSWLDKGCHEYHYEPNSQGNTERWAWQAK